MIKQVFVVFSIFLVLALSVVPCFASDNYYDPDNYHDPETWFVEPAVPFQITYHLDFEDSISEDENIHSFIYPSFTQIPLDGDFTLDPFRVIQSPRLPVVTPAGLNQRFATFISSVSLSGITSDYSFDSRSGTLSFTYDEEFRYNINQGTDRYPVALLAYEISAPDFIAFSHSNYDNIIRDQNSQLSLVFSSEFIDTYCSALVSNVSFSYAPITDRGLGEFQTYQSDFYTFARRHVTGSYVADPGRVIATSNSTGENVFYLIRDFSLIMVPNDNYVYSPTVSGTGSTYRFDFHPIFTCFFVYDPQFSDPDFIKVGGSMELQDYTSWITTAVSGFFDIQIFPGFYLSGFLMVIIAFACVIWFLKIFAGG